MSVQLATEPKKKTKHKSTKYNDVGNIAFEVIQNALNAREDLYVFILTHSETVTNAQTGMPMDKMKSIGKLVISKQYIAWYNLYCPLIK